MPNVKAEKKRKQFKKNIYKMKGQKKETPRKIRST